MESRKDEVQKEEEEITDLGSRNIIVNKKKERKKEKGKRKKEKGKEKDVIPATSVGLGPSKAVNSPLVMRIPYTSAASIFTDV
jgi:hypothetical protein